jgi:hypothetical protein
MSFPDPYDDAVERELELAAKRRTGGAVLCEKCGEIFKNWDQFQRHACAMGALREKQEVKRDSSRSKEGA